MQNLNKFIFLISVSILSCNFQINSAGDKAKKEELLDKWFSAAYDGNLKTIRDLVGNVDINAQNFRGLTALHCAVFGTHEEVVKYLLTVPEIDINFQDHSEGNTPLIRAVRSGRESIVKLLLEAPHVDIEAQDNAGETALMWAAYFGYTNMIKLMIQMGANVNAQSKHGSTALINGAIAHHKEKCVDAVKFLLDVPGININAQNKNGKTAFMHADAWRFIPASGEIAKLIRDKLSRQAFEAIKHNNIEMLKKIIAQIGPIDDIIDGSDEVLAKSDQDQQSITDEDIDSLKEKTATQPRRSPWPIRETNGDTLLDKACAVDNSEMVYFLLQNTNNPQELLARFPFEFLNPTSAVFELIVDLAYPKEITDTTTDAGSEAVSQLAKASVDAPKSCAYCSHEAALKCAQCKTVYYCSVECQKADWHTHKHTCKN